jgi:small subunit ribosomal protein S17
MSEATAAQPADTAPKGVKIGVVESDKRDKTRKVVVSFSARHPKYGKYIRRRTVLHVHDENNESRRGDRVQVVPCRPMSKTKSWRLLKIMDRHQQQ